MRAGGGGGGGRGGGWVAAGEYGSGSAWTVTKGEKYHTCIYMVLLVYLYLHSSNYMLS